MRHLYTLIAAVFVAPLSWILLAFGQDRSAQAFANAQHNGAYDTSDFVRPMVYLAVAGLLLGLLATLRFSPLGAVLTGMGYAASYVALLFDPKGVLGLFPKNLSMAGHSVDPTIPLRTGTAMLLGALMLVAAVSVGRWRRWPSAEEPEQAAFEQAQDRPLGMDGLGLGLSHPASAEPELVARYGSSPRRSGIRGPNSYENVDTSTGQGQGFGRPQR
jgi:hypothetical protein